MEAKCVCLLIFLILATVDSQQCEREKQPFLDIVSLGRPIGRWYVLEHLDTESSSRWNGLIIDVYEENGTVFANFTWLSESGDCGRFLQFEFQQNPDRPEEFPFYSNGRLAGYAHTAGGSYTVFSVVYVCLIQYFQNGSCKKPFIEIWSRTKILSDSQLAAARQLRKNICMPEKMYTYKSTGYGGCLLEEPNQSKCESKFIPFQSRFVPLPVKGRWNLMAAYYREGDGPGMNLLGSTVDLVKGDGYSTLTPYAAISNECHVLEPSVLKTVIPGQVIEFGGPDDVHSYRVSRLINGREDRCVVHGTITHIVEIDYENYALIWTCREYLEDNCIRPYASLWSRTSIVSPVILKKVRETVKFLCNPEVELLFPSSVYETCPPKPKKVPKCRCEKSMAIRATSGGSFKMLLLVATAFTRTTM